MNLRVLLGWGIVIYAIVFLVWSGLVTHGLAGSVISQIVVLGALIFVVTLATKSLGYRTERDIIPYAIGWMLISVGLDAIYAVPYSGWQLYADWNMWVGYLLLLVVPMVVTAIRGRHHGSEHPTSTSGN